MLSKSIISISGPSGSGKTTLTNYFKKKEKVSIIKEPISDELLNQFSISPSRYAYVLQEHIIRRRFESFNNLLNNHDVEIIVFDRTVSEDIEVFFKLHHSLGYLSNGEVTRLLTIADKYKRTIANYDEFKIGLNASPETLLERLQLDENHIRPSWLIQSLSLQCELYKKWFNTIEFNNFIDTSKYKIKELDGLAESALRSVRGIANKANN